MEGIVSMVRVCAGMCLPASLPHCGVDELESAIAAEESPHGLGKHDNKVY